MAEVVKAATDGHVVDLYNAENSPDLTQEQADILQSKLTEALFEEDDIANLKFEEPNFDGIRLRLVCSTSATKDWIVNTFPQLIDLWDGAEIRVDAVGPPPNLVRSTVVMPAKTYGPPVFFSIISAQNPTINTKFWRYQSRTKVAVGRQTWTIFVDENSIPALKEIGFRPHVGLGRVKISVNNNKN